MLHKILILCTVLSISLLAFGQEKAGAPKAEIFGGYQYFHASTGVSGVSGFNLNGWNASASGFFTRNLGVTADFSGSLTERRVSWVSVSKRISTRSCLAPLCECRILRA
jgi:hypothetical protein